MAVFGHRDYRTFGRHGDVRVSGGHGVVGCRWAASGTTLFAGFLPGTFAAARAFEPAGGAPGAGHLQWENVRLAIAGESLHDDALDSRAASSGASGFAASRAGALETAAGLGAAGGTGEACVGSRAAGVEPGRRRA